VAQFQSEIELRVKVVDKELRDLEKRAEKIQNTNPFSASGAGRGQTAKQNRVAQAALQTDKKRLQLQQELKRGQVSELQQVARLNRLFKDAAKVRASYAKDAEKAAKAVEREAAAANKVAAANKKARNQKIQSAVAGGVISAAFPILTGGGGAESALGGIGGLLGSAFGPLGSFAGGIGGSALGRIITDAEELNKSLIALNTRLGEVGSTSALTASDISKLSEQLNIAKEDVITLAGELGGLVDQDELKDVAKLFGPIGGAATFEAVAKAAQGEAEALTQIDGLRGQISRETAEQLIKVLEIEGSEAAQAALLDALTEKSKALTEETAKTAGFWETISAAILTANSAQLSSLGIGDFVPVQPEDVALDAAGIVQPDQSVIDKALAGYENYLQNRNRLNEKYNPKNTRSGGRAAALPQSKELQLRQQILKTELSMADIETKRRALQATALAAIKIQDRALYEKLNTEIQILELARQQALVSSKVPEDAILINNLYDQRLEKLQRENDLQREQNLLKGKQIKLQKTLTALRSEQQTAGIVQGLERNIEDANSRSSSEMLALRINQLRREEDLIGGINDKLAEQATIQREGTAEQRAKATEAIKDLTTRKAAIEGLLPALNQAEQAQLRFNQAFTAVTPAVNSLVSGFRQVAAGTKSTEEAFADFLNTIADQLAQTAAQMIAQFIAIGIARQFATGASGGVGAFGGGNPLGALTGSMPFTLPPGRAEGGPVTSGSPYIVGERGPELFVPGSSGNIIPNGAGGGNTVVNVNVNAAGGGGSASSKGERAAEATKLARMVESSTMQVITREKRPGGLLY